MSREGFANCKYSLEELEQFRDENGFIDLTDAEIELSLASREKRGTEERIKNWVDFNGQKALIRGQTKSNGELIDNYCVFSELIVEEIAKKLGIETAHYDLIKIKDENGKYQYGVLSQAIIDFEKEDLVSLHDFVGDEPQDNSDEHYIESTRYTFVIEKFKNRLEQAGYTEEEIKEQLVELKKRLLFYISVVDLDKHLENISYVMNKDGKIRIAPNYDSEISLLLHYSKDNIQSFCEGILPVEEYVNENSDPKIGIFCAKDEGGRGCMWADTLEALIEDDEVYDYYYDCISGGINMDEILSTVEKRINAPLPKDVKKLSKMVYEARAKTMDLVMDGEELDFGEEDLGFDVDELMDGSSEEPDAPRVDPFKLLEELRHRGQEKNIRTGEIVQEGLSLFSQIEKQEKKDESTLEDDKSI